MVYRVPSFVYMKQKDLLNFAVTNGMIDLQHIQEVMEMKKKWMGILLFCMLLCTFSTTAFAAEKGKYPYYMSETVVDSEDGFAGMATVTAKFVDDTHFTLQITADGKDNDGKYISIYKAQSSFSNQVMSIHCADEIGEKFKDQECYYNFEWLDVYDEYSIKTAVISMTDERVGETEDTPKFFGTDDQYVSMDCAHEDKAFMETYNLAYFYEV